MYVGQHNNGSELAVAAVLPYVVQEDTVPAPVLLLLWLALAWWTDRILELTGFLQDRSQQEHQRAWVKYILLFCWWRAIQLGKGRFNISLDLFSGIQIRKENALKQKYDHSGGSQRTWRGSRGKGTTLVLSIYLFDGYNRTWLFDPSDCFCTASLMPGGFRPAPQEDSPGWRGSSGGTEPFSVVPENQSSPSTSFKLSLILTALTI